MARLHDMNAQPLSPAWPRLPPPPSVAFDRWLRHELARRYDSALTEPVPDELLRLVHAPQ